MRDYQQFRQIYAASTAIAPHLRVGANDWGATFFCPDNGDPVNDPQYVGAVDAAGQPGGHGRLVTYLGWGHGAYTHSSCTTSTSDSYLIDRTLPNPVPRGTAAGQSGGRVIRRTPRPGRAVAIVRPCWR